MLEKLKHSEMEFVLDKTKLPIYREFDRGRAVLAQGDGVGEEGLVWSLPHPEKLSLWGSPIQKRQDNDTMR